jgi:predicted O-methyltransferase YrrM
VTPGQGKLLWMLARVLGARRILEIGTLGGYSTIWMASALPPDGRLVTLEVSPKHAKVARANIRNAGMGNVEVRLGKALDSLAELEADGGRPFDLVFIDADKSNNAEYFRRALRLTRPGSLIVVDNVVREGRVVDASSKDPDVLGVRALDDLLRKERLATATAVQTVGSKGHDGFIVALVTGGKE